MDLRLEDIKSPEDIRRLSTKELYRLAEMIRAKIIETVSKNGGHLGASLGTVELTLALHSVFDTPRDKIVWDVGHQTYAHKIITGRYERFDTLRKLGGISGYPKRQESVYDVYDTGHSSGSISYALGLARARDLSGEDYNVVAVIGDGALTAGLAYEGLNNAGEIKTRLIVVVNDNSMSISKNVGGIAQYLTLLRLAPAYRSTKAAVERILDRMPNVGPRTIAWLRRFKGGLKYFLFPEAWFEALGFRYYGPINGHDIEGLKRVLEEAKHMEEPVLIHTVTEKGRGYPPAREQPEKFHGPGPFDPNTGEFLSMSSVPTWSKVFGTALLRFAEKDERIVAITAAMADGTGLNPFKERFPERFFDVGIAEGHAVTFAAGLSQGGLIPVVAIYSTFLQRAYDQIIEDVCLQGLKVVFAIDRAGIVGEDGETHQGQFDVSYLRPVPGITIMAPKDERELVDMLYTALKIPGPVAIRYPRGPAEGVPFEDAMENPTLISPGQAEVLAVGEDINLVALGSMVSPALQAKRILEAEGISCGVVNARFAKPLDARTILDLATRAPILVLEENAQEGGFGEAVLDLVYGEGKGGRGVFKVTLPGKFIEHGSQQEVRRIYGLDAAGIVEKVRTILYTKRG
ncbi:MAG TPA: 1-deoxy-D-xylulose-5-phosphate synthase [Firmicutes bacterium]|uniref:1-deoxy-D-xylulose-5-phosphate synthase n=1 Tax=Candidatus Fermentithermobacillus carboniphilus TaxID=3085328 RepID=A0AAT9LCY9_9FIRM|nr:MAG: 1-deoxy-D-xylulose-5-phosphate synthase [Candidatus Fermentithermobacillus carboniphilus]HHW17931.1 1-deoxy-D-xylulose-5-phosphate synthase [Candidatus Fermentithermobacillaceae bacterium]